jgi:hypothetical protein
MMLRYLPIVLAAACLWAGQSLDTSAGVTGAITVPSAAPYSALTDSRVEVRLTGIQPCLELPPSNVNYTNNWFRIAASSGTIFSLGCNVLGEWGVYETIGLGGTPTTYLTPAEAENKTDLIFRMQKDQTNQRYTVEIWTPDGTRIKEFVVTNSSLHKATQVVASSQAAFIGGGGSVKIAWLRWFSSVVPLNAPMPSNAQTVTGDLGDWEFEGNLNDTSGHGLNITYASPSYAASPVYAPFVHVTPTTGNQAGSVVTLDGSASFVWDDTPTTGTWQQVKGPSDAHIHDRKSLTTQVSGITSGDYRFRLTVGASSSLVDVSVASKDLDGLHIAPTNDALMFASRTIHIRRRADAVSASVVVRKPDGRTIPPIACATTTCVIPVDKRQANHAYKIAQFDAGGKRLSESTRWIPLTNVPTTVDSIRSLSETWNRWHVMTVYGASWRGQLAGASKFASRYLEKYYGSSYYSGSVRPHTIRPVEMSMYIEWSTMTHDRIQAYSPYAPELTDIYENVVAHSYVDYDTRRDAAAASGVVYPLGEPQWWHYQMDRLDATTPGSTSTDGVMLSGFDPCPTNCTNLTTEAYSATTGDIQPTISQPNVMMAYSEPWDEVRIELSSVAVGSTVTWQRWTGSAWTTIPSGDFNYESAVGCRNFTVASCKLRITPSTSWVKAALSGTIKKWWLRANFSGGTMPAITKLTTDDWQLPEMPFADRKMYSYTYIAATDGGQFSSASFTLTTVLTGTPGIQFQYWNGTAWAELVITDGTNAMKQSGSVSWTPPGDWAALAYNGSVTARYWVRYLRMTASGGSTIATGNNGLNPAIAATVVLGGGGVTTAVSTGAARGWSTTDANRVNVGTVMEYNPSPPAGSSARFRYQSRLLAFYNSHYVMLNHTWSHPTTGKRGLIYAMMNEANTRFVVTDTVNPGSQPMNYNALFFDDVGIDPASPNMSSPSTLSDSQRDFPVALTSGASSVALGHFVELFRTLHPEKKVGINWSAGEWTTCTTATVDFCKQEGVFTFHLGAPYSLWRVDADATPGWIERWYDKAGSPADNPYDVTLSVAYSDYQAYPSGILTQWDRANRTTVGALALHWIAANEHTRFAYNPSRDFYVTTTQLEYVNETPDGTLAAELTPASTSVCSGAFGGLAVTGLNVPIPFSVGEEYSYHRGYKVEEGNCLVLNGGGVNPYTTYAAGANVYLIGSCMIGAECNPPIQRVRRYGWVFPAMGIDVGLPTSARQAPWKDKNWLCSTCIGSGHGVWRRDYTKAVILWSHPPRSGLSATHLENYGTLINFASEGLCSGAGCELYPLYADGLTRSDICNYGPGEDYRGVNGGCTAIKPRIAMEGYILMKQPVY